VIVLDTTVLLYAVGGDHPLADPCKHLIAAIGAGRVAATTTPEVIQEFLHVRSRRRTRSDAAALGRTYAELLAPLLVIDGPALAAGVRLFERSKRLGAFDAILAAATIGAGADAIVSTGAGFDEIRSLTWWSPSSRELQRLFSDE